MRLLCALIAAVSLFGGVPELVSTGFEHFYSLEYDQAVADFKKAIASQPENPNLHNHLAQTLLYKAMYEAGALESELVTGNNPFLHSSKIKISPDNAAAFDAAIQKAMSIAQAALTNNANDADAMYTLGVAYGLRGNYNFLVRKAWIDALKDATQARKLHNKVSELKPDMIDARLVQGVHDYVVGSLPFTYKILGFVAGFRGDKDQGIKTLQLVAAKGDQNKVDAQILLAVIYRRERHADQAVALLQGLVSRYPRNYLYRLEMVQMYGDLGKKDEALVVLNDLEKRKREGAAGFDKVSLERIWYSRGNLLFWYREYDTALDYLRRVTQKMDAVDTNTGMNAWLRQGQILDLKKQRPQALAAYQQAVNGAPDSDAAREAKRYLDSPYKRS